VTGWVVRISYVFVTRQALSEVSASPERARGFDARWSAVPVEIFKWLFTPAENNCNRWSSEPRVLYAVVEEASETLALQTGGGPEAPGGLKVGITAVAAHMGANFLFHPAPALCGDRRGLSPDRPAMGATREGYFCGPGAFEFVPGKSSWPN